MDYPMNLIWKGRCVPVRLVESAGVGARQVADRGAWGSRLYTAVLAWETPLTMGAPVWLEPSGGEAALPAYPVYQQGRTLRLHRRDGEFAPGLVLERLGQWEQAWPAPGPGGAPLATGGDDFAMFCAGGRAWRTTDFERYAEAPDLAAADLRAAAAVLTAGEAPTAVLGGRRAGEPAAASSIAWSRSGGAWTWARIGSGGPVVQMEPTAGGLLVLAQTALYFVPWSSGGPQLSAVETLGASYLEGKGLSRGSGASADDEGVVELALRHADGLTARIHTLDTSGPAPEPPSASSTETPS